MTITQEDFQRARRISDAIQTYLIQTNKEGVRSTDIYPYLARQGLVEKDRHNGLHFRKFLRKLKQNNLLGLIPQCKYRTTSTDFLEWYFYKAPNAQPNPQQKNKAIKINMPRISEEEINNLIKNLKAQISNLPKIDESTLTIQRKETRSKYPRAYERWTSKELQIMMTAFKEFNRIDKVAELLQRQPSAVERRINEYQ